MTKALLWAMNMVGLVVIVLLVWELDSVTAKLSEMTATVYEMTDTLNRCSAMVRQIEGTAR